MRIKKRSSWLSGNGKRTPLVEYLRERDGSYWTGLVYSDGKRWPVERTTWTGAAVVLAGMFTLTLFSFGLVLDRFYA